MRSNSKFSHETLILNKGFGYRKSGLSGEKRTKCSKHRPALQLKPHILLFRNYVYLNSMRITCLAKDFQQDRIRNEEKPWKDQTLLLQVPKK